jgi:hypothetical protein
MFFNRGAVQLAGGAVFRRGGVAAAKVPETKIILTGYPPVEVQLADQVRSATGMTYGVRTPDGAKMASAFMSNRITQPVLAEREPAAAELQLTGETLRLYRMLQTLDAARASIPDRTLIREHFGHMFVLLIRRIVRAELAEFWDGRTKKSGAMALRLKGSSHIMRTADAPPADQIVFA